MSEKLDEDDLLRLWKSLHAPQMKGRELKALERGDWMRANDKPCAESRRADANQKGGRFSACETNDGGAQGRWLGRGDNRSRSNRISLSMSA